MLHHSGLKSRLAKRNIVKFAYFFLQFFAALPLYGMQFCIRETLEKIITKGVCYNHIVSLTCILFLLQIYDKKIKLAAILSIKTMKH